MDRRKSLQLMAGLPLLGFLDGLPALATQAKKHLRMVQITDTHIQPEDNAEAHTRKCIEMIAAMKEKPDIIFHTGDVIMDALKADKERVKQQWAIWKNVVADLKIPVKYCIGNHDVWGLPEATRDPMYGKKWAVDEMKLPRRYYSFEQGGWHFIFLDSTHPLNGGWYTAKLDDEQFEWLSGELQRIPSTSPVMIASHIPLLSSGIFDLATYENNKWEVGTGLMHADSHRLQQLLLSHKNIKVCISGHLHLLDSLTYNNISYMGCGAVCGNWWKSDVFHNTIAGYSIIDLFPDGSIQREYVRFPWSKA